jgi:hypothetical protein
MSCFRRLWFAACILAVPGFAFFAVGCSSQLPPGFVGRLGRYDYSPSVIQTGDVRQIWWCGVAVNPQNPSQDTDSIQYESLNTMTKTGTGPRTVMAETPGTWNAALLCNPKVIGGIFPNPLGDGQTYQYAMYFVATADFATNNIGVAFSNDGINWLKYPDPVIRTTAPAPNYGVGQPSLYNSDQHAGIWMIYEDRSPTVHHVEATSTDGVHFTVQGTVTMAGLNPDDPSPTLGDMAYDPTTSYWYAIYDLPLRDTATTGGIREQGQLGVALYKIPNAALLTGSTPWQELHTFDTNMTGFESNFIGALVHDQYGNINIGRYPTIDLYASVSDPAPSWDASPAEAGKSGDPGTWDLAPFSWSPGNPLLTLNSYYNGVSHLATTGWVDPFGGFGPGTLLGHLYESPQQGATIPFYSCKAGSKDYFVSLDSGCGGQLILGKNGYGYAAPVATLNLVAIYRCHTDKDHFVSTNPKCDGYVTDQLLGYVLP